MLSIFEESMVNYKYITQKYVNFEFSRLSAEMSHKVSSDERSLENINVEARPMKLADEYRSICSEEWLEAGEALESMDMEYDEDERYKILCSVIEVRNRLR